MGTERSNLFAEDPLDDLQQFQPKKPERQPSAVTKQAAAKAGFVSREAKIVPIPAPATGATLPPASVRPSRRRRTGRNVQFNLKATAETIAGFCAIADAQGWVLGEALEKAVELLREKYGAKTR